jgi:arylsulfatase A-like enzyme/predicted Zn-dependent protease
VVPEAPAPTTKRPNVLVITVDTLRADRLGCYGFEEARTPNIDELAKEGVRVKHAVASAPITLPSHASIFTGFDPPAHGVRDNGTHPVPAEIDTLAELLKRAGYETQAFISAEVLHSRYGLDQGFDGYDDELSGDAMAAEFVRPERSARDTMDRVLRWLQSREASTEPYFLWVHLFDPHQPYDPPPSELRDTPTLYDAEIAFVDGQIGRLVSALETRGTLDDTILVFTSDHGESLGEHGEDTHAVFIYESTIRVPLIVRYPRKLPAGRVHMQSVRSVDIMPTILGLADQAQAKAQGSDLSEALRSPSPPPALAQYSESFYPKLAFGMAPLQGVRLDGWTYIRAPRAELYNRATDPAEAHNLLEAAGGTPASPEAKKKAAELERLLSKLIEAGQSFGFVSDATPLDQDTVEMLQALGYIREAEPPDALRGMDPKDGIRVYRKISEAFRLARDGDCPGAVAILTPLLERVPSLVLGRNMIAKCELKLGNPEAAKRHYTASLALDPDQEEALLQLGRMELAAGKLEAARGHLLHILEVIPQSVDAMVLLGYVDWSAGQPDAATRWYTKAIDADPGRPLARLFLADLYFRQGDFREAKRLYDQVLEISPNDFTASLQAGLCMSALGEPKAAEPYLLRARRAQPSDWRPPYNLACVRARQGQLDLALEHLGEAVGLGFSDAARLQADPCFGALTRDPKFQSLTSELTRRPRP